MLEKSGLLTCIPEVTLCFLVSCIERHLEAFFFPLCNLELICKAQENRGGPRRRIPATVRLK